MEPLNGRLVVGDVGLRLLLLAPELVHGKILGLFVGHQTDVFPDAAQLSFCSVHSVFKILEAVGLEGSKGLELLIIQLLLFAELRVALDDLLSVVDGAS